MPVKQRARPEPLRRSVPLHKIVAVQPPPYASANVENDAGAEVLRDYIPGSGTMETVARLGVGMRGGKRGRILSVTGPYGSGKSTMAVFLDGLASPMASQEWKAAYKTLRTSDPKLAVSFKKTRTTLGAHKSGLIRCFVTARREPVAATVLRALHAGASRQFGKYGAASFEGADNLVRMVSHLERAETPDPSSILDAVRGLCKKAPVLMLIDEFGKNIEHFADEDAEGDLFLMQELAEMSRAGSGVPLFIVTLQHMAFEEYAAGVSTSQRREWSKIQGRFEDVQFANSPEQTRLLVTNVLKLRRHSRGKKAVEEWARARASEAGRMGLGGDLNKDLLVSCYPLHPLVLEALPELCARYGQYERTLISFLAGGGANTAARFISEAEWDGKNRNLPSIGLETLYDYFVSGSSSSHATSSNASRLLEIETIVRDAHGLTAEAERVLKSAAVLNLVGRSGRLRASAGLIGYATGADPTPALRELEGRSVLTYRRHSDEYRIWHGTDVDIRAELEVARRKLANASLADMLNRAAKPDPAVAARHAMDTGTVRIFEMRFADADGEEFAGPQDGYDGAVVCLTGALPKKPKTSAQRPVVLVEASGTDALRKAAVEASAVRDVLEGSADVSSDWVAKGELAELLAMAEAKVEKALESSFGAGSRWLCIGLDEKPKTGYVDSESISSACDAVYADTPRIRNEMINRNVLSPQGSMAVNRLMNLMITRESEPGLGIEGWGPERTIYESVLRRTGIHTGPLGRKTRGRQGHRMRSPESGPVVGLWAEMERMIKKSKGHVSIESMMQRASLPPFGAKAGLVTVIVVALLLARRDMLVVYEHGTYCPKLTAEMAERLAKNPAHFDVRYVGSPAATRPVLETVAADLGIDGDEAGLIAVVGHLVRTVADLPPYVKKTRMLGGDARAVRDAVLAATEPDTLLFESLPLALGMGKMRGKVPGKTLEVFSERLAAAVGDLRSTFEKMLEDIRSSLFVGTGVDGREKISVAASAMMDGVSDHQTKVFLGALAADALERDEWTKYVAMTLADAPPGDWTDEDGKMFRARLKEASAKFRRLAGLHFAQVSESFAKRPGKFTATYADGREHECILPVDSDKQKRVEEIVDRLNSELGDGTLDDNLGAILSVLIGRSEKW